MFDGPSTDVRCYIFWSTEVPFLDTVTGFSLVTSYHPQDTPNSEVRVTGQGREGHPRVTEGRRDGGGEIVGEEREAAMSDSQITPVVDRRDRWSVAWFIPSWLPRYVERCLKSGFV